MTVALGQVSRNIYDAVDPILRNKQIETQERIARAQIRAANQRAALGAAQNALGMLNANRQREADRQFQQQRDAQQRRLIQQNQQKSRLQQILEAINRENSRWDQHVEQMRQRGFQHNPDQMQELFGIDQDHNKLAKSLNEKIKEGDTAAAEAIAQEMLATLQNRWIHQPKTEIPPKFEQGPDGRPFMRGANGNPVFFDDAAAKIKRDNEAHQDRQAAIRVRANQEARDAFNDIYQSGGTYNEALAERNRILTTNGQPPSALQPKNPGDPGFYYNDPKATIAEQKGIDAEKKYLRERRDTIIDNLNMQNPGNPGRVKTEFDRIWKEGKYDEIERNIERAERGLRGDTAQQPSVSAASDPVPQEVIEAAAYLERAFQYKESLRASGKALPDPQAFKKSVDAAKDIVEKYRSENPGKLEQQAAGIQAQSRPAVSAGPGVQPGQAAGPVRQAPLQVAPQAGQPPVPAEGGVQDGRPQGPFKRGNLLNGPRVPQTSSLGLGGTGVLGMGPVPLQGVFDAMTRPSSNAQTQRDSALATAPDASDTARNDLEDQIGFLEKVRAWVERNPVPNDGSYRGIPEGWGSNREANDVFDPKPWQQKGETTEAFNARTRLMNQPGDYATQNDVGYPSYAPSVADQRAIAGTVQRLADAITSGKSPAKSAELALKNLDDAKSYGQLDMMLSEIQRWKARNPGQSASQAGAYGNILKGVKEFYSTPAVAKAAPEASAIVGAMSLDDLKLVSGLRHAGWASLEEKIKAGFGEQERRAFDALERQEIAYNSLSSKLQAKQSGTQFPESLDQLKTQLSRATKELSSARQVAETARQSALARTMEKVGNTLKSSGAKLDAGVLKALGGFGKGAKAAGRLVGPVATALQIFGMGTERFNEKLIPEFRDWAKQRMEMENNQADQFGIPRDEARRLSNAVDGYRDQLKPQHEQQIQSRADKTVPPPTKQSPSDTTPLPKSRPQIPSMTVSPFAFVSEQSLRDRIWNRYSNLWDKLPERWIQEGRQEGRQQGQSDVPRASVSSAKDEELRQLSEKHRRLISDRNELPWEQYKNSISELAESWARAKGYQGRADDVRSDLMKLSREIPNIGNWTEKQPNWTKPNGLRNEEWSKLTDGLEEKDRFREFLGPHFDKTGSYLRQEGFERYHPEASRQQSNQNQIQVSRDADGNTVLTNSAGKTMNLDRPQLWQLRDKLTGGEPGPSSAGRDLTREQEELTRTEAAKDAVKWYGVSGNSKLPDGEDGKPATEAEKFTAQAKTAQLNGTLNDLDYKGELPPSVIEFDKYPSWVTKLPAASWTDKEGKEHHRNDVPTDEEGLQNLINEISKQKGIGRYEKEEKSAQDAADQSDFGDAEGLPVAANARTPEMQEYHLRTPRPPSREAFEGGLRAQGLKPEPGEYEEFIKARNEVRGRLPSSAEDTAPGNLFIDKDGTLKQSDGKGGGVPLPANQPLPPGYVRPQFDRGQPQRQQAGQQQQRQAPLDARKLQDIREAEINAAQDRAMKANSAIINKLAPLGQQRTGLQPSRSRQLQAPISLDSLDRVNTLGIAKELDEVAKSFSQPTFNGIPVGEGSFSQPYTAGVNVGRESFDLQFVPQSQPLPAFRPLSFDNSLASNSLSRYQFQNLSPSIPPSGSYIGGSALDYYEPPSFPQYYNQPPDYGFYDYQPQFEPVGPSYFPDFNYSPQPSYTPLFDNPGLYYESSPGYYAPGDYGGYSDYSSFV